MTISYRIDRERSTLYTTCSGFVTLEQVLEHFDVLERDPERTERMDVLLDLTEITSLPNRNKLRSVAERIAELRNLSFGACAIVTVSETLFGMMRMFEVFSEKSFANTQVFQDLASAEVWLLSRRSKES
jgi:hypothetical protein